MNHVPYTLCLSFHVWLVTDPVFMKCCCFVTSLSCFSPFWCILAFPPLFMCPIKASLSLCPVKALLSICQIRGSLCSCLMEVSLCTYQLDVPFQNISTGGPFDKCSVKISLNLSPVRFTKSFLMFVITFVYKIYLQNTINHSKFYFQISV